MRPRIEQGRLAAHLGGLDIDRAGMHLDDLADAAAGAFGLADLERKTPPTLSSRRIAGRTASTRSRPTGRS